MGFDVSRFVESRPFLYHLTATSNLPRIRSLRCLESAELLFERAGFTNLLKQRRPDHKGVTVDGTQVTIRDQSPLYEGNIDFEDGWTFGQFIALLNQRVFFWPGNGSEPISYGLRHYERYESEKPAVIRVSTQSLLRANESNPPLFCRYNSGSPRCSVGKKSPRGSQTFLEASQCSFPPGKVVEVTFVGAVTLPNDASLRSGNWSNWESLFAE